VKRSEAGGRSGAPARTDMAKLELVLEAFCRSSKWSDDADNATALLRAAQEQDSQESMHTATDNPVHVSEQALYAAMQRERAQDSHAGGCMCTRAVADLRPRRAVRLCLNQTVTSAARILKAAHADAGLAVSDLGVVVGILTDVDVAKKVIARGMDPSQTLVSSVMTPEPMCVMRTDSAAHAVCAMLERHFRHLPVLNAAGQVEGLLSIDKCLFDAMGAVDRLSAVLTPMSALQLLARTECGAFPAVEPPTHKQATSTTRAAIVDAAYVSDDMPVRQCRCVLSIG